MPFPTVPPDLGRSLSERGYAEPTPVQAEVLKPGVAGKDLLVSAQTGSGKTVAFGLAMGATLLGESGRLGPAAEPLALVVAPTRELALQVHRELSWLYQHAGARVVSCVGGMDPRREQRVLAQGAHIVVGTPGRLRDHLERGNLEARHLRVVILDEADEMLDLGFREDLEFLLEAAPADRRTLLFSATIPKDIAALARRYQRDAVRIVTSVENEPHGDIDYRAVRVAPNDVDHAAVNVLRYFEARGALVFCSTREAVRELHGKLLERGFAAVALSGELSQAERTHALQALRDGRARVCVATDVAARGIDLPDLGLVIHADLPRDREVLLHRSGRTGRAGRKGICVLLVPHTRRRWAERLLASANIPAKWMPPPSADEVREEDRKRLLQDAAWAEAASEEERSAARALLSEHDSEEVAVAFIRLHRARLPAPEELLDSIAEPAPGLPDHRRGEGGETAWFRMNIGRNRNADPRWLVPLICRRGHVTKREIGTIRISDRETRFEIAGRAAARVGAAARRPPGAPPPPRRTDDKDKDIQIEAVRMEHPGRPRERHHRPTGGHRPVQRRKQA